MLLLALDTTFGACSAAVFDAAAGRVLAARFELMDKGHAETIAPMVQDCLAAAGCKPNDLARIAVTRGPGTFTGLRIGLSLAHGMAAALRCDIVGFNSLIATAAPVLSRYDRLCVVHQAGATGKFYAARFERGGDHGDDAVVFADLAQCVALAREPAMPLMGTGADAILAAAPEKFQRLAGHDLPEAAAFAAYAAGLPVEGHMPQPLYLREPDAKPAAAVQSLVIRAAAADDLPALSRLHGLCFDRGWSVGSLASALSLPGSGALVAALGGEIRAFVQYQIAADEAEINTLCTEPRWRRRGLAARLLAALRQELRIRKISRLHLEVAADNKAADRFYSGAGFSVTGRRKAYYERQNAPSVDAVLMSVSP